MTRPIDADVLSHKLKTAIDIGKRCEMDTLELEGVLNYVEAMPTIDAVPVRPGKWIPCAKSGLILTEQMRKEGIRWYGFKCSVCGFIRKGNAPREANYCECCGADMRGDNNG